MMSYSVHVLMPIDKYIIDNLATCMSCSHANITVSQQCCHIKIGFYICDDLKCSLHKIWWVLLFHKLCEIEQLSWNYAQ